MIAKSYFEEEDRRIAEQMERLAAMQSLAEPEPQVKQMPYEARDGFKEQAYRMTQPKHASVFTKSCPTTKARKAARRRAKAGRKASR